MVRFLLIAILIGVTARVNPAMAQAPAPRPVRPTPPTRDPHTTGYVTAKELPDGENAPATEDGNFILAPTHNPAPEMALNGGATPQAAIKLFRFCAANPILEHSGAFAENGAGSLTNPLTDEQLQWIERSAPFEFRTWQCGPRTPYPEVN